MHLTKSKLKQIIKEELQYIMQEIWRTTRRPRAKLREGRLSQGAKFAAKRLAGTEKGMAALLTALSAVKCLPPSLADTRLIKADFSKWLIMVPGNCTAAVEAAIRSIDLNVVDPVKGLGGRRHGSGRR